MKRRVSCALLLLAILLAATAAAAPRRLADCEADFHAAPQAEESASCFYNVGRLEDQGKEALRRAERLLAQYPESPWLLYYLGDLRWHLASTSAEVDRAADRYLGAADQFERRHNAKGALLALYRLYSVLRLRLNEASPESARGEMRQRLQEALRRGLQVASATRDPAVARARWVFEAQDLAPQDVDLPRAYKLYSQACGGDLPPLDPYFLQRDCLAGLGNAGLELGRTAEAHKAFAALRDLAAHSDRDTAMARYGIARSLIEEAAEAPREALRDDRLQQAVAELKRVRETAAKAGDRSLEAKASGILCESADAREAREHLRRCLDAAEKVSVKVYCLDALARRLESVAPEAARQAADRALGLAGDAEDRQAATTNASWERMRVSWALAPAGQDAGNWRAALAQIEALRDRQKGDKSVDSTAQAELFSTWADYYHWLSGRLLNAYAENHHAVLLDQAFEVAERMRAGALREALRNQESKPEASPSISEVREALAADQALLAFQVAPWKDWTNGFGGGSWLLAVTRGGTRVYPLPDRVALRDNVAMFSGLFERRDGSEMPPSVQLYASLLRRAMAELPPGTRRLILIPDDALHQLPFAVLRARAGAAPLATRYELSLAPSATLWLRWRRQPPKPTASPILALGDAKFGADTHLERLPHTGREAKAAVDHLGSEDLVKREAASESFLKRYARPQHFAVLHLATHALVDDVHPERSTVELTKGGGEDGHLQMQEIVQLPLDGQTVVLSACSSASGAVLRGEGVMGLARAFFQARAHTVVASLWRLRDREAADFFDRFYCHLGEGSSVAAALAATQREALAAGDPAEAWAGIVVLGDGDQVPLPGGRRGGRRTAGPWTWAGGAVVLLLLAGLIVGRRRRRRAQSWHSWEQACDLLVGPVSPAAPRGVR
jgi:CHAT domain-containing protein